MEGVELFEKNENAQEFFGSGITTRNLYDQAAAKHLPDNVSEETKIARLNELIKLQTEVSAEQNKKDEGKDILAFFTVAIRLS